MSIPPIRLPQHKLATNTYGGRQLHPIKVIFIIAVSFVTLPASARPAGDANPNVLFIAVDDLRNCVGAFSDRSTV